MADYQPTIITASLDDNELKSSINNLVAYVDKQTKAIMGSFDTAVSHIKTRWGELNDLKVNLGSVTNTTTSTNSTKVREKNIDTINRETQAIKEQNVTLDQQAAAMQRAQNQTKAVDSYYTFVKDLRENLALLSMEIKAMPSLSLDKQFAAYTQYEHQIEQVRQRIGELRAQMNEMATDPNASRLVKKQTLDEIAMLEQKIVQLEREQISTTNQIAREDKQALAAKQAEYETQKKQLLELSVGQREMASFAQKEANTQHDITEEIKKRAQAIRESAEYQSGKNVIVSMPNGYDAVVNIRDKVSIEEKLTDTYNKHIGQKSELDRFEQSENTASKERLSTETAITQEVEKQRRKKYNAPDMIFGYDVTMEKMAQIIANKNKIERNQVVNWDEQASSIKSLSAALKQYQNAYARMTATERNSIFGKQMVSDMQVIERSIQKLRQETARPIDIDSILRSNPQTLDDIAYKMRQLLSYRSGLNVNTQRTEINQVNAEYDKLKKKMDEVMQKNTDMLNSNNALGRSWNYMKNRLAFYFTVGASTQFVKQLVDVRGQYELLERSIGILIDSAQNGSKIFAELNAMAIKSPFTTMELGAAAKQLVAYDVAAKDVVDTTRRLADMAAAVGIPMERLTYALGQIKAYGYLNARDARMFANAGIPLVKELADYYTKLEGQLVSTSDVYDRIKKKAIDYTDVMKVVNEMTDEGGRFFNFQEKAADTLKVRIANLTLAWNNMLNEIGKDSQGVLTSGLVVTRDIFNSWRSIINTIKAVAITVGSLKAVEIAYFTYTEMQLKRQASGWLALQVAMRKSFGATISTRIINSLSAIGQLIAKLANPATLASIAITAISIAITKAVFDYRQLQKENKEFNESITKNAEENVNSINKFFDDYKRNLSEINSLDQVEQQKLWERVQEEIEKTVKNSQQFIDKLNEIQDVAKRIKVGEQILDQSRIIENEVKRLSERGAFNIGGGFANDEMAKDLVQYTNSLNDIKNKYGDVSSAAENASFKARKMIADYITGREEVERELDKFVGLLNNGDITRIAGTNRETQVANIREYATIIRDSFLATEEGQKITSEGQALLNHAIDEWIAKIALSGRMFKQIGEDNNKYNETQQGSIEANRTAWEAFFAQLSKGEQDRLDFLISANKTGSKDFQDLWDKATERMKESATSSYNLIEKQIAELRNTPAIVIDIVYRNRDEKSLDEQINEYRRRYIEPSDLGAYDADSYERKVEENTKKYGKFIKKEGEDNVEWEKRLGEAYQNNEKSVKSLTAQIAKSAKMSDVDKNAKQGELDTLKSQQEVLKEIEKAQGFNFAQFEKGGKKNKNSKKDIFGDALAKEVQLIGDMQKRYREYQNMGVNANDSLTKASEEYGKSIINNNAILRQFGVDILSNEQIAKSSYRTIRDFYKEQLKVAQAKGNTKGVEALEKAVANLNIEIAKVDYKKLTDGLNSELSKLKGDYELAVELDANPELGEAFSSLFDINPDELPQNIDQYAERLLERLNYYFQKSSDGFQLPTLDLTNDDIRAFSEQVAEGTMSQDTFDRIKKAYDDIQSLRKKDTEDTIKQTRELQYKLVDVNDKIAIEDEKLQHLLRKRAEETNEKKKLLLDLQIQDQEETIAKLGSEVLQLLPTYKLLFNSVVEHSAMITRRIAKQWKGALENAVQQANGSFKVTDPISGQITILSKKEYGKELDKVNAKMRETASTFKKLKEAFTKGEEDDIVDVAMQFELIGEEAAKAANGVRAIAEIIATFASEDSDASETLNDIAESIDGMATASQGVSQVMNGDIIGGTVNVIKGTWQAISTWFDNQDKKITRQIKSSQREVKRLGLAYAQLESEVERAMGAAETGARRAAIENKRLQLVEMERQLQLEESRKGKKRDEDAILDLKGQVADARRELQGLTEDVVNTLMGSDIKSAAEEFVDTWVQAWRAGETTLDAIEEKMDDVIFNIVKKAAASKIVSAILTPFYESVDEMTQSGSEGGVALTINELRMLASQASADAIAINEALGAFFGNLQNFGIVSPDGGKQQLSALQAGIQGITEETAGALEAYMNSVSQQVYLQSDLLTQIRDIIVGYDMDVQMGTMGQILLQLQQSYQVQMSIQGILEGWNSASGQAVRVELIS